MREFGRRGEIRKEVNNDTVKKDGYKKIKSNGTMTISEAKDFIDNLFVITKEEVL